MVMISLLQGAVSVKRMDQAVVDVHGVGYHVSIPLSTYYVLPDPPESVTLFTMLHVREDAMQLYGFATPDERAVFELLVGVSSIGPRLALNMLSSIEVAELQHTIAQGDVSRLQTIPGIGSKTAGRIVLELQEKVGGVQVSVGFPVSKMATPAADPLAGDAVSALLTLGYKRGEAEQAVQQVRADATDTLTVEALLKEALKQLGR
jgi:Holliday junction DNA helicase RuvA